MPELFPGTPPKSSGDGISEDQIGVTVQGFSQDLANIASLTTEGLLRRLLDGTYETIALEDVGGSVDWANPGAIGFNVPNSGAFTSLSANSQLVLTPEGTPPSGGMIRSRYNLGDFVSGFFGGFASNLQFTHTIPSLVAGIHNTAGAIALQWTPIGSVSHGRVLIGTGTDNGADRLQVNGAVNLSTFLAMATISPPTAPASGLRLFSNTGNNLAWRNPASNIVTLDASGNNASRTYALQNKSGTIAHLDDIPAIDADLQAIAALTGTGYARRTGDGVWALDTPSGGSTPSQSSNSYFTYLSGLSGLQILAGLEDWTGNIVFNRSNSAIGYLSGNFAQQRPSVLSDSNARSTLFRTGGALLDETEVASSDVISCSIVCRFRASASARGVLFSYGNTTDFSPTAYDRVVYLNGDTLSVYGFDANAVQAVNLDSVTNVRDGLPHTVVARFSPSGVDLWLDNVKIIDDPRLLKQDYAGYWRIGHGLIFGTRSSSGGFARGINIAGFATFNRLLLDGSELQGIHTNA